MTLLDEAKQLLIRAEHLDDANEAVACDRLVARAGVVALLAIAESLELMHADKPILPHVPT